MILLHASYQIIQPGVWKQTIEIMSDGHIVGFMERERTPAGILTKTQNMQGDSIEGECLEWLLRQTA
jgi:hypothetical protein